MSKKPVLSAKEQKRIIEMQLNNKQSKKNFADLKKQLIKLTLLEKEEVKKKKEEAEQRAKEQEEKRKLFELKQKEEEETVKENLDDEMKLICKFFIEATDKKKFVCPDPNCKDVHELDEEETFDDHIQKEMMNVKKGEKVTEETFKEWLLKKQKEDKIHEKKKQAIKNGIELFLLNPELFKDDDEVDDELLKQKTDDEEEE